MKRGIKIGLAVVMAVSILGLGLIGCAKPAPAPAPAPAPTPAPKPTPTPTPTPAAPKVYKLKFSTHHSPTHTLTTNATIPFIEAVKKRSGGRIDIALYPSATLAKWTMALEALRTGVADIAYFGFGYHLDLFPLQEVLNLPAMHKTTYDFLKIFRGINDEYFKPSMDKVGLVNIGTTTWIMNNVFTTKTPVYRIEDLKGLTLMVVSPASGKLLAQLGGIPMTMDVAAMYDMLQKGTLDGIIMNPTSVTQWRLQETGKPGYWADLRGRSLPAGDLVAAMNKTVYDSLPADLRKIIDEASWEFLFEAGARAIDAENAVGVETMREYGTKIINWNEAEVKRLDAVLAPTWDEWAKKTDAKGLPGSKLVAAMRALAAK